MRTAEEAYFLATDSLASINIDKNGCICLVDILWWECYTSDHCALFHLKGQGFLLQCRLSLGLVRFCRLQYSSWTTLPDVEDVPERISLSMHVTFRVISPWSHISEHWKHTNCLVIFNIHTHTKKTTTSCSCKIFNGISQDNICFDRSKQVKK